LSLEREKCTNQYCWISLIVHVVGSHREANKYKPINPLPAGSWWLMPVILATEEAGIRRITVQSQLGQIVHKTLSQKYLKHKKRAGGVAQGVGPKFKLQPKTHPLFLHKFRTQLIQRHAGPGHTEGRQLCCGQLIGMTHAQKGIREACHFLLTNLLR
jgi:hypothetical protein